MITPAALAAMHQSMRQGGMAPTPAEAAAAAALAGGMHNWMGEGSGKTNEKKRTHA